MAFIEALTPKPVLEFEGTRPAHLAALVRFGIWSSAATCGSAKAGYIISHQNRERR